MQERAISGCQNKHKAHRQRVKAGYYKQQYNVTERNKHRRALARKRRFVSHPKQRTSPSEVLN